MFLTLNLILCLLLNLKNYVQNITKVTTLPGNLENLELDIFLFSLKNLEFFTILIFLVLKSRFDKKYLSYK